MGMDAAPPTGIPGSAPPMLWLAMCTAVALWWLWPWLDRWFLTLREEPLPPGAVAESSARAADSRVQRAATVQAEAELEDEAAAGALVAAPLGFEPAIEFERVFTDVCGLIGQLLDVPPVGAECAAANAAIHKTASVLDRIFLAWGSSEELARVSHIREQSAAFSRTFGGSHRVGRLARQLLQAAGFERFESDAAAARQNLVLGKDATEDEVEETVPLRSRSAQTKQGPVWIFRQDQALSRLQAMTVRLCLKRFAALQKMRGTMRWVQDNNLHVIPKPDDGCLPELLALCRETRSKLELPAQPSQRERLAEASLRAGLNERRSEAGCSVPLLMHDGLTAVARVLAYSQRKRVREGGNDKPARPVDTEVQKLLLKAVLPPGFDAAHLHFASDELPHVFGLASTTGQGEGGGGASAELLAKEAVGFWAARQSDDLAWPYAAVCGVGVALDYTVNRGFMVALLIGYEGVEPLEEEHGALATAGAELRKRRAAAQAAAQAKGGAETLQKSCSFGARVKTLDSGTTSGFTNAKGNS